MRAGARKRCRCAPSTPRTGAGIAHGNVPRTTQKAKKERKARTGTAILFLLKKTRRRRNVKARIFIKVSPRERLIKKRTCTAAKYEKSSKFLCQNCVASLFLLIFLTFCVVRDHEAMGSNPVTPTIKNTHALFALCVFYLPAIRDLNGTLRKQHSALFLVPGVIATALAAQKRRTKRLRP